MTDSPHAFAWSSPSESPAAPPIPAGALTDALAESEPPAEAVPPAKAGRGRKKRILLWASIPIGIAALVALACGGFYVWSQTQFSVIERDQAVVVQHGVEPFVTYERTDVNLALLPTTARTSLVAHISADDRAAVAAIITDLRGEVTTCEGSLKAPCPIRPLEAAAVSTTRHEYPRGDEITISWSSIDDRKGVRTKLTIDGRKPAKGCPSKLTNTGTCTLQGKFDTTYTIAAVTSGPEGSSPVVSQVDEFTALKPKVTAIKGKQFSGRTTDTDQAGRFCKLTLRVEGFAPDTGYKVKVLMSGHDTVKVPFTTDASGTFSGRVYAYGDPTRNSWVATEVKGVRSKNVTWECGGL